MEARTNRPAQTAALAIAVCLFAALNAQAASYRTRHFVVTAPTAEIAKNVCEQAEVFRRDLAIEWLGRELPDWSQPCPITVQVGPNMGAGGATSFMFDRGRPFGWRMSVQGSYQRIMDSVLPHEVTHTIFATHFGQPLPRWADEGACTTVEHASEKAKQQKNLVRFLQTNRGIAFNKMFAMKEYPPDVLPLYAQGYSVTRYLIQQGGKPHFVNYVAEGLKTNNWPAATRKFYGYRDLSDLQVKWVAWVGQGSPPIQAGRASAEAIASAQGGGATVRGQSPDAQGADELVPVGPTTTLADNNNGLRWRSRNRRSRGLGHNIPVAVNPPAQTAPLQSSARQQPPQQVQPQVLQAVPQQPAAATAIRQQPQGRSIYDRRGLQR